MINREDISKEIDKIVSELMEVFKMETIEDLILPLKKENREILDCLIAHIYTIFIEYCYERTILSVLSNKLGLEVDTISEIVTVKLHEREMLKVKAARLNTFFIPDLNNIEL